VKIQIFVPCLVLVLIVFDASMRSQRSLDEPPGKLEIAKHPLVLEKPAGPQARKLDPAQLQQEALDLAELARTIPGDVDQTVKGKLPKDLADKLKHIERLSKRLRGELIP
jgi:hypothetical protein